MIDTTATLAELVTQDPRRARVLETFGLDYCCNGNRPLTEAATQADVDVTAVAAALDLPDAAPEQPWQHLENAALAHDIVDTHHAYLWEEMPRLQALVDKVARVHGERHPELLRVQHAYTSAVVEIEPHLTNEERRVFPAITRLEKGQSPASFAEGSLEEAFAQLMTEHDAVGDLFKEIRALTDGYAVPGDACGSYRAMLGGLEEMEADLHLHIHKENNILFPRVLELLRSRATVTV